LQGNFKVGDFTVAPSLNSISLNGTTSRVEPKAMQVLACLAEQPGEVVGKEQLIQKVWADTHVTDDVLTVCISALRKAFNDSARESGVIQTIPKRGYRLIAPVVRGNGNGNGAHASAPAKNAIEWAIEDGAKEADTLNEPHPFVKNAKGWRTRGFSWTWIIVWCALALVMLAGYFLLRPRRTIDSVAILPFAVSDPNPEVEGLSEGIEEGIIDGISQLPKVRVMAWSTVTRYKGQKVDPRTAGKDLGVQAVLTGQVSHSGDDLVIQTELVDVQSGTQLWGQQYNRKLSDVALLQAEIARQVSGKLRWRLTGEEEKKIEKRSTTNPEAYQLYVKGRYFWNKRTESGMQKAIEYFQQAIEKDPSYAVAYAGLADSYDLLDDWGKRPPRDSFPKARAAAMKALELDDSLAEAHTSLAFVKANYDWDFAGGEKEFKRAIELDPNYATAHQWYAMQLAPMRRFAEAEAEIKRAQELDPLSLIISMGVGEIYEWEGRHELAVAQYKKTLEMDGNFAGARGNLAGAYEHLGRYREAVDEMQKEAELAGLPDMAAQIGRVYRKDGFSGVVRLELTKALEDRAAGRYVPALFLADHYARSGHKKEALDWLERAYQERDSGMILVPVNPDFDPLRGESRYQGVMRLLSSGVGGMESTRVRESSFSAGFSASN
jgi:DNA-binding winged helix-turn-helix (wHTH) protein/TolB-like protein/Tfp pilus assembly protein PilF